MRAICRGLVVTFQSDGRPVAALDGVSFETREGEFLSVVGPSGCGKTTLLRVIAGLLSPTAGSVAFDPPNAGRRTGGLLVFQENSLFPWMTALENAAFGLEMLGVSRQEREQAVRALFERHGLAGWEEAYPYQLSAGMKQRVAVLRAFLSDPPMLLMDEPFAALDSLTRAAMQSELLDLWQSYRTPVIFVTHDVEEAIYLSDRILVLSRPPARVVAEVGVPFPRTPDGRERRGARAAALKEEILGLLGAVRSGVAP